MVSKGEHVVINQEDSDKAECRQLHFQVKTALPGNITSRWVQRTKVRTPEIETMFLGFSNSGTLI